MDQTYCAAGKLMETASALTKLITMRVSASNAWPFSSWGRYRQCRTARTAAPASAPLPLRTSTSVTVPSVPITAFRLTFPVRVGFGATG